MKRWARLGVVAVAMVAASACASGPPRLVGQLIRRPVSVVVRVSDEASQVDDLGATATLVETLTEGLAERGVKSNVFAHHDDRPPTPRIEIWVEKWDPGDEGRRAGVGAATLLVPLAAVGQIGAEGEYSIYCRIFREGEQQAAYEHRYSGGIYLVSGTSNGMGESIAESILRRAFSDAGSAPMRGR